MYWRDCTPEEAIAYYMTRLLEGGKTAKQKKRCRKQIRRWQRKMQAQEVVVGAVQQPQDIY